MKIKFIYLPSTVFLAKKKKTVEPKSGSFPPDTHFFPNLSSVVGRFSCKRALDTWSDVYVRARGMYYTTQRKR